MGQLDSKIYRSQEGGRTKPFKAGKPIILHEPEDLNNGLELQNIYLPEELIVHILSYVEAKDLLRFSTVCCKWHEIITDGLVWRIKYEREYHKKAKHLPWYVYYCLFAKPYFDRNLMKNSNGDEGFKHWTVWEQSGNLWKIENPPIGAKPLPENIAELSTGCFATSYQLCSKYQVIKLTKSKLICHILDKYQPHIYISEWFTGRFDCGCKYTLEPVLGDSNKRQLKIQQVTKKLMAFTDPEWEKAEIVFKDYGPGVKTIMFAHSGKDTQFWAGNYGSKMAGGVCKILFDSIESS